MKLSKLTFLLATLVILFPTAIASARNINVEAGDVRINLNSGQTRVSPYRSRGLMNRRFDRYRYIRQNSYCSEGRNFSRQESTQISRSNRKIVQTNIYTTRCH